MAVNSRTLQIAIQAKNLTAVAFGKIKNGLKSIALAGKQAVISLRNGFRQVQSHLTMIATLAAAAFAAAVKSMAEFNKQLALTGTLGEEARAHLGEFSVAIKQLAVDTGIPLVQLNKALFDTISAGTKAADAMGVLEEAAKLAVAGGANLATTVRGLATITNAYGLSGKESFRMVAEELFAAQVIGKTTIDDLSENIGKLASTSAEAGVSIRHMFTALADAANVSANTEQAAVSLRQAIMAILKPNEDMIKVLRRSQIPMGVAAFQWGSLGEIFSSVKESAAEMNIPFVTVLGNVRAIASASVLAQRSGARWNEMLGRQSKLAGELAISYENMQKQLATTIERAKNLGRILAQAFATGATVGLNKELGELADRYEEMAINAELAGLEFRKFIETDIKPLVNTVVSAFQFMKASATILMTSIEGGFDALFSTIAEGFRETIQAMEAWGLIDSPLDKFNDDLARFRIESEKTTAEISKVKRELRKTAKGTKGLFGWGDPTQWSPTLLADQLKAQIAPLREAIQAIDHEMESLSEFEMDVGDPKQLGVKRSALEKEMWKYLKPLDEINKHLEKQAVLEKDLSRHEQNRIRMLKVRGKLEDEGAVAAEASKRFSEQELRDKKGFWALELSHFSAIREARADVAEVNAFEQRALVRTATLIEAVKTATHSLEQIQKSPFAGDEKVIAGLNKEIARLETSLKKMANMKTLKNLADTLGVPVVIGWMHKFRDAIYAAGAALEDLRDGALPTGKTDDSIDWWVNFKKGMEDVQDELQVTEDDFKDMGGRVMQSLEDSVQSIFQGFVEGKDKAKDALLSFLRAISQELTRFMSQAVVRKFLAAFFTGGGGGGGGPGAGDGTIQFEGEAARPFAHGGIVRRPTSALIGEAGPEAVVPLPNGRSIPVDFRGGGGGGGQAITINISAVDGLSVQRMLMSDDGKQAIQAVIRDARSTRRDLR
ncbi:MAG: phage tail tape measure protein [bacterium]